MALAIKRIHNLPHHLSYVSTLPDITQKPNSYVVFLSVVLVDLKRMCFGGSAVALKRAGYVGVRSDIPLPLHIHAAVFPLVNGCCLRR